MSEKKSILDEALLDIKKIQNTLDANTKEILRSVAKEEIDSVVKESLTEEIYDEEDIDTDDAVDTEGGDVPSDSLGDDSLDLDVDSVDDIETPEVAPEMEPEIGMDEPTLGGDDMDLTNASDDDVIAIYKKLSGEDEIEIVDDEIHLSVSEPGEYVIKTPEISTTDTTDIDIEEPSIDGDEMGDVDYEIELDDENGEEDGEPSDLEPIDDESEESEESEDSEEVEDSEELSEEVEAIEEAIPVGSGQAHRMPYKADLGQPKGAGADNLKESKESKSIISETTKKYNLLLTETAKLKSENEDFRKALKEFRTKLVETVIFNSNLTYVTKLFTEHTTTKSEKQNIIKRFDEEVTSLKESKKLYKSIVNELENRKPISESIENRIITEPTTGTSKKLNESTAYIDSSTQRIKDLINRVESR